MAKGNAVGAVKPEEPKDVNPQSAVQGQEKHSFTHELAALTYYKINGTKTQFEMLPEAERSTWYQLAGSVIVALDKMNKMVVAKKEVVDIESGRNKNINRLTEIIVNFVSGLKAIKCPKCGSNAELRALIFPSNELAHRIWDGEV